MDYFLRSFAAERTRPVGRGGAPPNERSYHGGDEKPPCKKSRRSPEITRGVPSHNLEAHDYLFFLDKICISERVNQQKQKLVTSAFIGRTLEKIVA